MKRAVLLFVLVLVGSLHNASGVVYTLTDETGDVIKVTYAAGAPVIAEEDISEGSVDIKELKLDVQTSGEAKASMTFDGTPVVDEFHWYFVSFNLTKSLNSTHSVELWFSGSAGLEDTNVTVYYFWALYNQGEFVFDTEGNLLFGTGALEVEPTVVDNSIEFSYTLDDQIKPYLVLAGSFDVNEGFGTWAQAMKSDQPNLMYNDTSTDATFWYDVYPESENIFRSEVDGMGNSTATGTTEESEGLPIPGFGGVAFVSAVATVVLVRRRSQS